MYQPDNILNELKELSAAVANIARVNVFTVPDGYFDTLSSQVLIQVHAGDAENVKAIKEASVPEGYFDNLAGNIMARIKNEALTDASSETKNISELVAGIGNKNIYSVPQDYFNDLSTNIIAQTKNILLNKVSEETFAVSELVAGIGNKNVYTIPQGYFEGVAEQINAQLFTPAKVVSIKNRFTAFRYAAAAVVTGVIGLSAFFLINKYNDKNISSAQTAAVIAEAKQIIKTNSFDKELSAVSDAAIVSFLESKGQNVEASLVASLTDDKNLPDADEYLINDNTLDEVLKTLDLNN